MQRVVVQQRRLAHFHDLSGVHHRSAVADRRRELEVVGDEQHGQAELAAQVIEDRHDLGLGGDIQRRSRLVGEQQLRLGEQRRGDRHALQHAAGQFVRVLPQSALTVGDPHLAEHVGGAAVRLCGRHIEVGAQRLGHEIADPPHRVHVRTRILEDHRDLVAVAAQGGPGQAHDVHAVVPDLAADLGPAGKQPVNGPRRHRLARTGLAHESYRLAGTDADGDISQNAPLRPLDPKADRQAVDLEQRLGGGDRRSGLPRTRRHGVHWRASGTVFIERASGTVLIKRASGTVLIKRASGTVLIKRASGTTFIAGPALARTGARQGR